MDAAYVCAAQRLAALEWVRGALVHDKVHATDGERCETQSGQIDRIACVIVLTGVLSEAPRERQMPSPTVVRCTRTCAKKGCRW